MMNKKRQHIEINEEVWMPEASRFGNILGDNGIKYAIFGAGALAVQDVMIRPTIDMLRVLVIPAKYRSSVS